MSQVKTAFRHAASIIVAATKSATLANKPKYVRNRYDPGAEIMEEVLGEKSVASDVGTEDLSILMVKRRSDARVMPNMYTFPGGALHPSDFDSSWATKYLDTIFEPSSQSRTKYFDPAEKPKFCATMISAEEGKPNRPPAMEVFRKQQYEAGGDTGVWMPVEWAFKVCALRELFEETGILICHNLLTNGIEVRTTQIDEAMDSRQNKVVGPYQTKLEELRQQVFDNAENFKHICRQLNVLPAFWLLMEWSNWLTPSTYPLRARFDTIFYVIGLHLQAPCQVEPKELEKGEWLDPKLALSSASRGELQLAPPQIYELARMANFKTHEEFINFVRKRDHFGLQRNFPVLGKCSDDVRLAIFPGDDAYPNNPDFEACDQKPVQFDMTSDEFRAKAKQLHRGEFRSSPGSTWSSPKIYMNIKPACGHVAPLESIIN